ncbi:hypothetical protein BGE01nite_44080 [Brevifollis gellanilyticus]|uniref:Uncharacterized protein n=2 Tax=Brevifollis gellanilyticus TaxID=748831 RepID=A0A512MEF6_9BACT|nr:hypothetical protein BGE01nite_44080 [Brevifollis gellanilyticus]
MSESKERFIEILLAETGVELEDITNACGRSSPPRSPRFDYRMAVVICRLSVLQQNRYILASAQAFEKFTAQRKQADKLLEVHWKGRDPSKLVYDKWRELASWMSTVEDLEKRVAEHRQFITGSVGRIPGKAELEGVRDSMLELSQNLPPQILSIQKRMPAAAVHEDKLLPELADFAILQQFFFKADDDIVTRFDTLHALIFKPGSLADHPLVRSTREVLAQALALLELHSYHSRSLQEAQIEFHSGNIDKARHLLASLKNISFADLQYEQLRKSVSRAARLMNQLKTERRSDAVVHARTLLKRYPGIHMDSQLYHEAMLIIERGGWGRIIRYACAAIILLAGIVALGMHFKHKADARDHAQKLRSSHPAEAGVGGGAPAHPLEVSSTLGEQSDPND